MLAITNLILHDIEIPDIVYDDALSVEISRISEKDRVDIVLANPPFGWKCLGREWRQIFLSNIEPKRVPIYYLGFDYCLPQRAGKSRDCFA